jgi:hypothetical protein
MAAFSQEAELNRACPSVLICSQFGQERTFEQTNTCSEFASLIKLNASIEEPEVINRKRSMIDGLA